MDAAREGSTRVVRSASRGERTRPRPPAAAALATLSYAYSPARTRTNIAMFVKKSRANPNGATLIEAVAARPDSMTLIHKAMRDVGLDPTNLGDAYAAYWTNAWLVSRGRGDDPSAAQYRAVKAQSADILLGTPEVAALTDAQKQEFAEALMVQMALIGASASAAQDNPSYWPAVKSAVLAGAKATGLDLESMTLTDNGFELQRTGDASGTTPEPTKLANAQDSSAPTPYLLTAAAGGAGVLGIYLLGKRAGRRG